MTEADSVHDVTVRLVKVLAGERFDVAMAACLISAVEIARITLHISDNEAIERVAEVFLEVITKYERRQKLN